MEDVESMILILWKETTEEPLMKEVNEGCGNSPVSQPTSISRAPALCQAPDIRTQGGHST